MVFYNGIVSEQLYKVVERTVIQYDIWYVLILQVNDIHLPHPTVAYRALEWN